MIGGHTELTVINYNMKSLYNSWFFITIRFFIRLLDKV